MSDENVYLKHNAQVEPLFNQWYAWSQLIAPATAAMQIAQSHLKVMQSFVANPQIHVSALKNPAMRGGPFINYDASRVDEIKELARRTAKEGAHMLRLAEAIKALDELLAKEASGYSLEPLYGKIPADLRGFVELVYDWNNNPSARFIEGLMYKSPYYDQSSQSVALSLAFDDDRSFAFSTPRLRSEDTLFLSVPFADGRLDELFKMRCVPQPVGDVKEMFPVRREDEQLFASLFTQERPQSCPKFTGDGVRIRYFGHACILIESKDVSILCDPVISYKHDNSIFRYTYADLPARLDYVLITHNHQDHCMLETLLQLRHKIKTLVVPKNNGGGLADPSLKLMFRNIGFGNVIEIDEMEEIKIDGVSITGIPFLGEHGDLNIRSKIAYLISLEGKTVMCMADSNNIEPMVYQYVREIVPHVNVLFIGMECDGAPMSWVYAPLLTRSLPRKMDQTRRLDGSNGEKALDIVNRLSPEQVFVYAMGQEPWLTYVTAIQYTEASRPIIESNKLVEACRGRGITAERLFGHKDILLASH